MKKLLNFLKNFIIIMYILLIIFVTICLISYNDYHVTELGDSTFLPVIDEDLEPDYKVGDLLIINKEDPSKVQKDEKIFFYRKRFGETTVNFATVTDAELVTPTEVTFTVEGDYKFSSSNYIGKISDVIIIPKVGSVLSVLESRWGFLFLGVFPSLIAFLYTLHSVVMEFIGEDEPKKKKKKKSGKHRKDKSDDEEKSEEEIEETKKEESKEEPEEVKEEVKETKEAEEKAEEKIEETEKEEPKEELEEKQEEVKETAEGKEEVKEELTEEIKEEKVEDKTEEQKRKEAIENKMKTMTEEEKRALIKAKLDAMTEEEKKALIEAKMKKIEAEKNKKGEQ